MNDIMLTVSDLASVYKRSERMIRNMILEGKIKAITRAGRGRGGVQYMVPLVELPEKMQLRWQKMQRGKPLVKPGIDDVTDEADGTLPADGRIGFDGGLGSRPGDGFEVPATKRHVEKPELPRSLEECSASQRAAVAWWRRVLEGWEQYRVDYKGAVGEADERYVAWIIKSEKSGVWSDERGLKLSVATLYRKRAAWLEYGDVGLLDMRGRHRKGQTSIPEEVWKCFEDLFLDQSKKSVAYCLEITRMWAEQYKKELLPLPSYSAFYRRAESIPYGVVQYFRMGEKAFEDEAMPFISRVYDSIESNEYWIADNHTFDIISREDGKETRHRLYLTAFLDARSWRFMGWNVTNTPNSDSTLLALRHGVSRGGLPKYIYVDNGREFLVTDIGGRGHRRGKSGELSVESGVGLPSTILDRLGIKMINALPRNAKAKVIERAFKEVTEKFATLFSTYCGSNPVDKPERLKTEIKKASVVVDSSLREYLAAYIDGYYNKRVQWGMGTKGKAPDVVWSENLHTKRLATEADLNLMLLRSQRPQKVGRNGVKLELYGQKLYYFEQNFLEDWQDRQVYLRYDPAELAQVRAYDLEDRFIAELPSVDALVLEYGANKEDVKEAQRVKRAYRKHIAGYKDRASLPGIDALDVVISAAKANMELPELPDGVVIEPVRATEQAAVRYHAKAVGEEVVIPWDRMIEAAKRREGER